MVQLEQWSTTVKTKVKYVFYMVGKVLCINGKVMFRQSKVSRTCYKEIVNFPGYQLHGNNGLPSNIVWMKILLFYHEYKETRHRLRFLL